MEVLRHLGDATRKRLILMACILGSTIVFVDSTVVNVALPAIQRDLGGGLALQQWVVDAYLLTLGSLILVGGSLGDLFGGKRIAAIGTWTAWTGISFVIGPLVGGWLVSIASWRSIFLINVPFTIATLALVWI